MAEQNNSTALLQALERLLHSYEIETLLTEADGLPMLKARLTELGRAEGEALMEICLVPMAAAAQQPQGHLLQFYTTTASNLDEANIAPALSALNPINLRCPVGAFLVYEPLRQLCHKHMVVLAGEQSLWTAQAEAALLAAVETIDRFFDETVIIADDAANDLS